jgi:hypothetical protein
MKRPTPRNEADCRSEIERMLKNSQTKIIMPVVAFGVLRNHANGKKTAFTDSEIKHAYECSVQFLKSFLGHDVHFGARYEDAYAMRMSRYGFLATVGHLRYKISPVFARHALNLVEWIPGRIKAHIDSRVGIIPKLAEAAERLSIAEDKEKFFRLIETQFGLNPTSFEIISFAVIKVHLEKFACKIYRDTRTSAHDRGVDLATNFGVVYQVKKLRVATRGDADKLRAELNLNFGRERLEDGNVILVIDDISEEVRKYLVNMKVQSIKRAQLLAIARGFEDSEDRQKVLRVIYDEFRRDYSESLRRR